MRNQSAGACHAASNPSVILPAFRLWGTPPENAEFTAVRGNCLLCIRQPQRNLTWRRRGCCRTPPENAGCVAVKGVMLGVGKHVEAPRPLGQGDGFLVQMQSVVHMLEPADTPCEAGWPCTEPCTRVLQTLAMKVSVRYRPFKSKMPLSRDCDAAGQAADWPFKLQMQAMVTSLEWPMHSH